jgi:hypothetical protein
MVKKAKKEVGKKQVKKPIKKAAKQKKNGGYPGPRAR